MFVPLLEEIINYKLFYSYNNLKCRTSEKGQKCFIIEKSSENTSESIECKHVRRYVMFNIFLDNLI